MWPPCCLARRTRSQVGAIKTLNNFVTRLSDVGPAPGRDAFAATLAEAFDRELERWRTFGIEPLVRRWLAAAHPVGTALRVHDAEGQPTSGRFAGLAADGSLLLRLEDGTTRAIHAGDVTLG